MKINKRTLREILIAGFTCCCLWNAEAGTPPFFTTDLKLDEKGQMWMTEKGKKCVDVFSPEGTLLQSYPVDEIPTGILLLKYKAYITTFETKVPIR